MNKRKILFLATILIFISVFIYIFNVRRNNRMISNCALVISSKFGGLQNKFSAQNYEYTVQNVCTNKIILLDGVLVLSNSDGSSITVPLDTQNIRLHPLEKHSAEGSFSLKNSFENMDLKGEFKFSYSEEK